MRVGIGVSALSKGMRVNGVDGIGAYTRELGTELLRQKLCSISPVSYGEKIQANLFPGKGNNIQLPKFVPMVALTSLLPLSILWSDLNGQVDLFHSTDHIVPRLNNIPVVATVMDAIPFSNPEWVNQKLRAIKLWAWKRTTESADHIVTISSFSKLSIVEYFDIPEEKISVVPLGVSERFFERFDNEISSIILNKYNLPSNFFLFVGTIQPRKNIVRIIDAHSTLSSEHRKYCPLVIVGREGWNCTNIIQKIKKKELNGECIWLSYVDDIVLRVLMQKAKSLVFPSLCEGFGLPVIEAFASGLPVITSNTTSLPEVANDSAILVDPTDIEDIANEMKKVLDDNELTKKLVKLGMITAKNYSWSECALKTNNVYKQLLR